MDMLEKREGGFFIKEEYKAQISAVFRRLTKISEAIDLSGAEYSFWITNKDTFVLSVSTKFQGFLICYNHTLEVTNYKGEINLSEI